MAGIKLVNKKASFSSTGRLPKEINLHHEKQFP